MYCKHFMTLFGDSMEICIIGKSKRLTILEENLTHLGYNVSVYHLTEELPAKITTDIVVLPVPTLSREGNINISGKNSLSPEALLKRISNNATIISCGYINADKKTTDLNMREDFAYLNAIPTAEGAIYYALGNIDQSLYYSKILITGFGRVAKILSDRLRGLCNNITICARNYKDLSHANALSFNALDLRELKDNIVKYDLIFQTVPSQIITPEIIDKMDKNSIIIELSSRSAGTDFEYAASKGINVIHAPALPEKIAPVTAGNILTKSVLSILTEQNHSE